MQLKFKVENLSGSSVKLTWMDKPLDLNVDDVKVFDAKEATDLFKKSSKSSIARENLDYQLKNGFIRLTVMTDQLVQTIAEDDSNDSLSTAARSAPNPTVTQEQKMIQNAVDQSQTKQTVDSRFKAVRADDPESTDRRYPTPGTGRDEDEKVMDLTNKSLHQAEQERQEYEKVQEIQDQAAIQRESKKFNGSAEESKKQTSEDSSKEDKKTSASKTKKTSSKKTSSSKTSGTSTKKSTGSSAKKSSSSKSKSSESETE